MTLIFLFFALVAGLVLIIVVLVSVELTVVGAATSYGLSLELFLTGSNLKHTQKIMFKADSHTPTLLYFIMHFAQSCSTSCKSKLLSLDLL